MTTLLDIQNRIGDRLQDPSFIGVSSSSVTTVINSVIRYYKYRKFWFNEELMQQTLTAGSTGTGSGGYSITLPSDFLVEIQPGGLAIYYSNMFYPLKKVPTEVFDNLNVNGSGRPYAYTYRSQGIELYWFPDQAYTLNLRYLKDYPLLVNPTDTNDFLTYADMMITYNSLSRIYAEYKQDQTMESYYTARATDEEKDLMRRSNTAVGTGRLTLHSNLLR